MSYVNSPLGVTAKKEGTNITYYVRDTRGSILASYGANGTLFYFSEFNGSVAALYNTSGTEVGSYKYSPYGKTTATGTAAENNPFRYIGGLQDKDSTGADIHYKLGARYYDTQGHFHPTRRHRRHHQQPQNTNVLQLRRRRSNQFQRSIRTIPQTSL